MGLAVIVGILGQLKNDPEGAAHFRGQMGIVNEMLAKSGLAPHREPEEVAEVTGRCGCDSYPYSFVHVLRRAYVYRLNDPAWMAGDAGDEGADDDAAHDPVVNTEFERMRSHLVCHSDCEGFYVPIDFAPVLTDERVAGMMLGSSQRLMAELVMVAPAIGVTLRGGVLDDAEADAINAAIMEEGELSVAKLVWLSLYEAARLSIEQGTAIVFA